MKKSYFTSILFIHFITLAIGQINNPLLIKADLAYTNSNYELSAIYYSSLIDSKISQFDAYIGRGKAKIQLQLYEDALIDFKKAEELDAKSTLFQLAGVYALMNNSELAISYLKDYMLTNNKLNAADIQKHWYFNKIKNTQIWKDFWKTEWYNKHEIALHHANYLYQSGHIMDALEEIDLLLGKKPKMDEAYYLRAQIYYALKQYKQSLINCESAIKFARKNTDYILFAIQNQLILGKYKSALENIQKAISINPNNISFYKSRALIYKSLNKFDEAKADLELYQLYDNKDINVSYELGLVCFQLNDYLNALLNFNKVLELNPGNFECLVSRGDTYFKTKTYKYAERDYTMALDLNARYGMVYYKRAKARHETGNAAGVCNDLKKAMRYGVHEAEEWFYVVCK